MLVSGVRRSCEMVRSKFERSVSFSTRISMLRRSLAKAICSAVCPHSSKIMSSRFFSNAPKSSSSPSMAMPATPNTASFERMGRYRHRAFKSVSVVAPARSLFEATHAATPASSGEVSLSDEASPPDVPGTSCTSGGSRCPSSSRRYMTTGRFNSLITCSAVERKQVGRSLAACKRRLDSSSTSMRYARRAVLSA